MNHLSVMFLWEKKTKFWHDVASDVDFCVAWVDEDADDCVVRETRSRGDGGASVEDHIISLDVEPSNRFFAMTTYPF